MAEIIYYEQINGTVAVQLALRAEADLHAAGLADDVIITHWDQSALVAYEAGRAVGIITFEHSKWQKRINICQGWVDPEYRRRGIYRELWNALVEKAKELKAIKIMGYTRYNNERMLIVAKQLGRKITVIGMEYLIEK